MKNGKVKHNPNNFGKTGMPISKNADEAAFFFSFKNNTHYEIHMLTANLDNFYDGEDDYSTQEVAKMKARYQALAGKPYKYVKNRWHLTDMSKSEENLLKECGIG